MYHQLWSTPPWRQSYPSVQLSPHVVKAKPVYQNDSDATHCLMKHLPKSTYDSNICGFCKRNMSKDMILLQSCKHFEWRWFCEESKGRFFVRQCEGFSIKYFIRLQNITKYICLSLNHTSQKLHGCDKMNSTSSG